MQKKELWELTSNIQNWMTIYLEDLDSLFAEAGREKDEEAKRKREKAGEDKLKAIELRQQS